MKREGLRVLIILQIDPNLFINRIKKKKEVNFIDILGDFCLGQMKPQLRKFLSDINYEFSLSDVLDGKSNISIDDLAMMLNVSRKGGEIKFDHEEGKFYGEYYGKRLDKDNYLTLGRSLFNNIGTLTPLKNTYSFAYPQVSRSTEPRWIKDGGDVDTWEWPEDANYTLGHSVAGTEYDIVMWWSDDPNAPNGWVRGKTFSKSGGAKLVEKKGDYFRFGAVIHTDDEAYDGNDTPVQTFTAVFEGNGFEEGTTGGGTEPEVVDVDVDTFDINCGGQTLRAYYDDQKKDIAGFDSSLFKGTRDNPVNLQTIGVDSDGEEIVPGVEYIIRVDSIDISEWEDVSHQFRGVRIWWTQNPNGRGPYFLSDTDDHLGQTRSVVALGDSISLVAPTTRMMLGAALHVVDGSDVVTWPIHWI